MLALLGLVVAVIGILLLLKGALIFGIILLVVGLLVAAGLGYYGGRGTRL